MSTTMIVFTSLPLFCHYVSYSYSTTLATFTKNPVFSQDVLIQYTWVRMYPPEYDDIFLENHDYSFACAWMPRPEGQVGTHGMPSLVCWRGKDVQEAGKKTDVGGTLRGGNRKYFFGDRGGQQ